MLDTFPSSIKGRTKIWDSSNTILTFLPILNLFSSSKQDTAAPLHQFSDIQSVDRSSLFCSASQGASEEMGRNINEATVLLLWTRAQGVTGVTSANADHIKDLVHYA